MAVNVIHVTNRLRSLKCISKTVAVVVRVDSKLNPTQCELRLLSHVPDGVFVTQDGRAYAVTIVSSPFVASAPYTFAFQTELARLGLKNSVTHKNYKKWEIRTRANKIYDSNRTRADILSGTNSWISRLKFGPYRK